MSNVTFQLEEQLSDLRSNEIAYRFTAENRGPRTVLLRSLAPRVAEGVALLEVKDISERAVRLKHRTLCDELTATLKSYLTRLEREKQKPKGAIVRYFGSGGTAAENRKDLILKVPTVTCRMEFGHFSGAARPVLPRRAVQVRHNP